MQNWNYFCTNLILLSFSCSVMSTSFQSHGLQHARPPCPSPCPGACSLMSIESEMPSSCPCHPLLLPSIFPASGSFPMSRLFPSSGQNIGTSASVFPMNIQGWFPLGITGLITLLSKGVWRVFSNTSLKASILQHSAFFIVQLSHSYMTTGKNIALNIWTFVGKVMSLLFNALYRFIIAFLPKSKHLLISWLQSPSIVILEPKKIKYVTVPIVSPSICHEVMGPDAMIFVFWMLSFKPAFSFSSFTFIKGLFSCGVICISEVTDISPSNLDSSLCYI